MLQPCRRPHGIQRLCLYFIGFFSQCSKKIEHFQCSQHFWFDWPAKSAKASLRCHSYPAFGCSLQMARLALKFSKSCPVPLVSASPKSQCPAPPEISVDSKQLSPFPLLIHHIHLNAADMCLKFGMTVLDVEVCCTLLLNQYCSPADCLLSEHYVPSAWMGSWILPLLNLADCFWELDTQSKCFPRSWLTQALTKTTYPPAAQEIRNTCVYCIYIINVYI